MSRKEKYEKEKQIRQALRERLNIDSLRKLGGDSSSRPDGHNRS